MLAQTSKRKTKLSDNILVDTGFWIGLFDPRDQNHGYAVEREEWLETPTIVLPWPILYETVRTRLVRRPERISRFDQYLKRPLVFFVDDSEFRDEAYALSVEYSVNRHRPLSMVDMLCRLLIEDENTRIDAVLSPNEEDFRDVCESTGTTIL